MMITVFWNVMLYGLEDRHQCFREKYRLHILDRRVRQAWHTLVSMPYKDDTKLWQFNRPNTLRFKLTCKKGRK
jgi:hypothetical protein